MTMTENEATEKELIAKQKISNKWSAKQWKLAMNLIMLTGVLFVLAGVGLYLFTDLATQGVSGMQKIALTIGVGLVLLIPSKLFLTILLMGICKDEQSSDSDRHDS